MERIIIKGGNRLKGTIEVSGAKNAVLPILGASLLCGGESIIYNVPRLDDVEVMVELLTYLGARIHREDHHLRINTTNVEPREIGENLMRRMRASNLVLGPLLGRFGAVVISQPGGCNIGSRPMDLHLRSMKALGAAIDEKSGYIRARAARLEGADIHLDVPSVGATENILMAASMARGFTILRNAAREPEIVDLQNYLNKMGARISGAGTDVIRIEGVQELKPCNHRVIPDRVEAGTHLVAAAITGGNVTVRNVIPEHVEPVLAKLREAGADFEVAGDAVRINSGPLRAVDVKTQPYPGFPTDMQPQIMALLSLGEGTSTITENIFENRFKHVSELRRLGADIRIEGKTAIIRGRESLSGASVEASDLRAGAALVLAGLAADNTTVVEQAQHIDRGYERLEEKYRILGADIVRVRA
ncbi:MAG: UDP-N-acetylglucosamine 1-carboxyvinyltransferase [Candidatus Desulforudis sp.]|nr:UDP-N-acetylglucosamine 1-carboxyvinyltransferase [Desulforudis sp.]